MSESRYMKCQEVHWKKHFLDDVYMYIKKKNPIILAHVKKYA